jgi:hypothetical protein
MTNPDDLISETCLSRDAHEAHEWDLNGIYLRWCWGRRVSAWVTPPTQCPSTEPHNEHEWYEDSTLRRWCAGYRDNRSLGSAK